jgi:hypothetical protein
MLSAMDRLLFGDAASVFARGADGHEGHVNRSMNVISSGFQHDRYFAEVEEILISIFSREPFSLQPRYVADMGCGDGTFLRRVISTVREKTPRGKVLAQYPLTLVGIDLNLASLSETSRTLAAEDHIVITGDIGNPRQIIEDLKTAGVDPDQVLHIRSFLDHDRPFIAPRKLDALAARARARYLGAYSDRAGNAIPPATAVQGLVEHLSRWADVINRHGLILLEVHCQDPRVVRANIDQSESLYFDALEGFSQQLLVEADAALMAAAEAGLFPQVEYFKKFPSHLAASRITGCPGLASAGRGLLGAGDAHAARGAGAQDCHLSTGAVATGVAGRGRQCHLHAAYCQPRWAALQLFAENPGVARREWQRRAVTRTQCAAGSTSPRAR